MMNFEQAKRLSDGLILRFKPFSEQISVAGSIRRQKQKNIHDIDLLIIPKDLDKIKELAQELGEIKISGDKKLQFYQNDELIDIYFADKENWESMMLFLTGSKWENVKLRKKAKEKGWKLSQYGLYDGSGDLIDNTEKGIYSVLDLEYREPKDRSGKK